MNFGSLNTHCVLVYWTVYSSIFFFLSCIWCFCLLFFFLACELCFASLVFSFLHAWSFSLSHLFSSLAALSLFPSNSTMKTTYRWINEFNNFQLWWLILLFSKFFSSPLFFNMNCSISDLIVECTWDQRFVLFGSHLFGVLLLQNSRCINNVTILFEKWVKSLWRFSLYFHNFFYFFLKYKSGYNVHINWGFSWNGLIKWFLNKINKNILNKLLAWCPNK